MMRQLRLTWGIQDKAYDAVRSTPGSLGEAVLLSVYLIVWSLAMGAYLTVFVLTGVVTLLLVVISVPCFLMSKVSPKPRSQRSGYGPKARPVR